MVKELSLTWKVRVEGWVWRPTGRIKTQGVRSKKAGSFPSRRYPLHYCDLVMPNRRPREYPSPVLGFIAAIWILMRPFRDFSWPLWRLGLREEEGVLMDGRKTDMGRGTNVRPFGGCDSSPLINLNSLRAWRGLGLGNLEGSEWFDGGL